MMLLGFIAAFYALLFWGICSKRPKIALFLIFASAPFQNDISGGGPVKFSIAEIHMLLSVPLFLIKRPKFNLGPLNVPVLAYLGLGLASSLVTWRAGTLISMVQMALYFIVAVSLFAHFVKHEEDYALALNGLICVCVFIGSVGIATRQMYILGLHKNGVGASLACATIICAEMFFAATTRKRKMLYAGALVIIVGGLLFSFSRGSWIGAITGLLVIFALRRQFKLMAQGLALAVPVVAILWQLVPEENRSYATSFDTKRRNINARYEMIEFARNKYLESPIIGVGVGLRKEYDATNLFWLLMAETGPFGVITFAWIHFAFLRMVWRTQKQLNRSSIQYSLLAIGGGLVMSRCTHGLVDHYWARGATVMAWSAAGMAIHTYFATRRRQRQARWEMMQPEEPAPAENVAALAQNTPLQLQAS